MNEDQWAKGLLADPGFGTEPPSKVDPRLAVRKGKQRLWMRRSAAAVGTGAAVVLAIAGLPLIVPDTNGIPPPPQAQTLASVAPSRGKPPPAPTQCRREPLDLPAPATEGHVLGGEPTGRYAVGTAFIGDQDEPVLWDGKRPVVIGKPKRGDLLAIAVNSSGIVVMTVQDESSRASWIWRDGRSTELKGGYSAVAINARGDVAGAWLSNEGVHPPAVWPAGQTDKPRVLSGGDPGDHLVAAVGGIDDDGTVAGTTINLGSYDNRTPPPAGFVSRPVYWPAASGVSRELPAAQGFSHNGWVTSVRSGLAAGHIARIDPDRDRRGNRAVVWDLAAGTATLDDRLSVAQGVTPAGWIVGRSSVAPPAPGVAAFGAGLVSLEMPGAPAPDSGGGAGISDDGRVIVGSVLDGKAYKPVRWLCTA